MTENPDELVGRVYEHVLQGETTAVSDLARTMGLSVADVQEALATLNDLRLIQLEGDEQHSSVAISPTAAEVELVVPLELEIHQRNLQVAGIRDQITQLTPLFDKARRESDRDEPVRICRSTDEILLQLANAARQCRDEAMTMQPGGSIDETDLRNAGLRHHAMLSRGVRMRIIYQHPARTDSVTRSYAKEISAAGAQVRTSGNVFERLIVFDRELAFIPHVDADEPPSVAIIQDASMVGFLCRIFEHAWQSATVFDVDALAYGETAGEMKQTITALLASGLKDEVIAKRLGMSPRTCRRHISDIMLELQARSRFQAGVCAVRSGLLVEDVTQLGSVG